LSQRDAQEAADWLKYHMMIVVIIATVYLGNGHSYLLSSTQVATSPSLPHLHGSPPRLYVCAPIQAPYNDPPSPTFEGRLHTTVHDADVDGSPTCAIVAHVCASTRLGNSQKPIIRAIVEM
jgi:hypothetical protein